MPDQKTTNGNKEGRTMKKTLIFCFDGTCNDPGDVENFEEDQSITNIQKLHVLFGGNFRDDPKNKTDGGTVQTKNGSEQQSFYYPGVGTYGWWLKRHYNTAFAPEHFFSDVAKILNDAIKDLKKNYPEGSHEDIHVLVFGFSRGAALARMFAAVAKGRLQKKKLKEIDLKIDFLGVFDTVAAITSIRRGLGIDFSPKTRPSSKVLREKPCIKDYVQKVVHLVALDENRVAFQPTLFNQDGSGRITEVWFPGVHSDVGGGYWYDGLSDLALEHMIKQVKQECIEWVKIRDLEEIDYEQLTCKTHISNKDYKKITKDDIKRKALVDGTLHEHERRTISTAVAIIVGIIAGAAVGAAAGMVASMKTSEIAGMIFGVPLGTIVDAGVTVIVGAIVGVTVGVIVGKYIRKKRLRRREVRVAFEKNSLEKHPTVHESVQLRYKEVRGYRPHALRDVNYFLNIDNKQNGEPRQGVSALGMEQKTKGTDPTYTAASFFY